MIHGSRIPDPTFRGQGLVHLDFLGLHNGRPIQEFRNPNQHMVDKDQEKLTASPQKSGDFFWMVIITSE